jgi:hypothetical protein
VPLSDNGGRAAINAAPHYEAEEAQTSACSSFLNALLRVALVLARRLRGLFGDDSTRLLSVSRVALEIDGRFESRSTPGGKVCFDVSACQWR